MGDEKEERNRRRELHSFMLQEKAGRTNERVKISRIAAHLHSIDVEGCSTLAVLLDLLKLDERLKQREGFCDFKFK